MSQVLDDAVEREKLLLDNGFIAEWPLYTKDDISVRAIELLSMTADEWNKFLTDNNIKKNDSQSPT